MNQKDVDDFLIRYRKGQMLDQRLGQAFINFFAVECGCHKIDPTTGKMVSRKYCIFNDTDGIRVLEKIKERIK